MYPLHKIARTLVCMSILMGMGSLTACQLTVTNDTEQVVILDPLEAGKATSVTLQPGETKNYGQPHEHAHFKISVQASDGAICQRVVQQYACGAKPSDTQLTISSLLQDPAAAALTKIFTFSGCSVLNQG
jgi:hypothetical protein